VSVLQGVAANLVFEILWNDPGKKQPAWFCAVQLKDQVCYYVRLLNAFPKLCGRVAPAAKRVQGKSSFNLDS
jgi:hypothetical protein